MTYKSANSADTLMGQNVAKSSANAGDGDWAAGVKIGMAAPVFAGILSLVAFVGGFVFWAASAPLSGAAVASGVVAAQGNNLTVQHLEGGIIEKILVTDGAKVEKSQSLMKLDDTAPRAIRNRLSKRLVALQARAARLMAETNGEIAIRFSEQLEKAAQNHFLVADLEEQSREFEKRLRRHSAEQNIIDQKLAALLEQITGFDAQIAAAKQQLLVVNDDIKRKGKLLKRGLANRSNYNLLRRNAAELQGQMGRLQAEIGKTRSAIAEAKESKVQLDAGRAETAVVSLNRVRSEIADAQEQLRSANDVLKRTMLRAPSDGIVVKIHKNTPGSIIRSGEAIVTLLPTLKELVIEARINPSDIDVVQPGLSATLRFSALNQRLTPEVSAKVIYVSADRLVDAITQEPYYTAKLKIADKLPAGLERKNIFPGMPVEAYIKTGDRTFLSYLAKPIVDSFSRAFREE